MTISEKDMREIEEEAEKYAQSVGGYFSFREGVRFRDKQLEPIIKAKDKRIEELEDQRYLSSELGRKMANYNADLKEYILTGLLLVDVALNVALNVP
jgi:hypothetical protein